MKLCFWNNKSPEKVFTTREKLFFQQPGKTSINTIFWIFFTFTEREAITTNLRKRNFLLLHIIIARKNAFILHHTI